MKIKRIRKNVKALSPIFAILILIAIAVIAGIVVYMFTSGTIATMTGGGTAGQEKVAVEAVIAPAGTAITVHAKSTAGTTVNIDGVILKDSSGAVVCVVAPTTNPTPLLADGTLTAVNATLTTAMASGSTYTVTLTSQAGGSFVSSSFKVP